VKETYFGIEVGPNC